jgi:hypothetical protein
LRTVYPDESAFAITCFPRRGLTLLLISIAIGSRKTSLTERLES